MVMLMQLWRETNKKDFCLLDLLSYSCLSSLGEMSNKSSPTLVYHRKKLCRNSVSVSPTKAPENSKPSNGCFSAVSCEACVAAKGSIISPVEDEKKAVKSPVNPLDCNNSESFDGCSFGEDPGAEEHPRKSRPNFVEHLSANDRFSSSRSNMDLSLAFLKIEGDDTAECTSSSALFAGRSKNDVSEKSFCISILRGEGLLEGLRPVRNCAISEENSNTGHRYCSKSCKVCSLSETTQKMLVCDNCEGAFHLSCCNPRIKEIPTDEWFCQSCLKKKHKMLKQKICNSMDVNCASQKGRRGYLRSDDDLGPIAFMLKGAEKYATGVKIGKEFQAEVPEWSGPLIEDIDLIGEPMEINATDWSFSRPNRLSSIGNWLQCREVIDSVGEDADETICGKWRRAPLFEVQTEKWDCSCAVLWDPVHADCAVPQEISTDEVHKQLKYIETLRPRLAARKRKLGCNNNSMGAQVSSQELAEE